MSYACIHSLPDPSFSVEMTLASGTNTYMYLIHPHRRKVQQTSCGFHGAGHQPYQDVGQVVLDDRTLILEGLGQHVSQEVGRRKGG